MTRTPKRKTLTFSLYNILITAEQPFSYRTNEISRKLEHKEKTATTIIRQWTVLTKGKWLLNGVETGPYLAWSLLEFYIMLLFYRKRKNSGDPRICTRPTTYNNISAYKLSHHYSGCTHRTPSHTSISLLMYYKKFKKRK